MPPEPKPVANQHDFHAHLEATCRASIESRLKELQESGQLPDLSPDTAPQASGPGGPRAVGAIPGLSILAGLLAGPIVKQIEAQVLQQAELLAEHAAAGEAASLFPGVDTTIVQKGVDGLFAYIANALGFTPPTPGPSPVPSPVS